MKGLLDRLDQLSRTAYISIVILCVAAFVIIATLVFRNTRAIEDQQDVLKKQQNALRAQQAVLKSQIERTRRALIYTCGTTRTVAALTASTIELLKSQPPTPARLQTINTFQQYLITLSNDEACQEVLQNP